MRSLCAGCASVVALVGLLQLLQLAAPVAAQQKLDGFDRRPYRQRGNWLADTDYRPPRRQCETKEMRRAREAREKREQQTGVLEFDYDDCIERNYVRLYLSIRFPRSLSLIPPYTPVPAISFLLSAIAPRPPTRLCLSCRYVKELWL